MVLQMSDGGGCAATSVEAEFEIGEKAREGK